MIDFVKMLGVLSTGFLLGVFFFGGLLWTIERGLTATHHAVWFLGSWLLRITVVLGSFYFISAGQWQRLCICVAGFFIARVVLIHYTNIETKPKKSGSEVIDAT